MKSWLRKLFGRKQETKLRKKRVRLSDDDKYKMSVDFRINGFTRKERIGCSRGDNERFPRNPLEPLGPILAVFSGTNPVADSLNPSCPVGYSDSTVSVQSRRVG